MTNPTKPTGIPRISSLLDRILDSQPREETTPEPAERQAASARTFLIVGLGNPGKEYAKNRHNIGFMVVDRLAARLNVRFARMQSRALTADARHAGHRLILVKPQTYMNESGQAVAALQKFYKVPLADLIVCFDDMDLPLGRIRIRPKGGSSGQKGMRSIIQRLSNNQAFPRIRLGIGRPPGRMPAEAFLLQDFSRDETAILDGFLDEAVEALLAIVADGLEPAMNRFNGDAGNHD